MSSPMGLEVGGELYKIIRKFNYLLGGFFTSLDTYIRLGYSEAIPDDIERMKWTRCFPR